MNIKLTLALFVASLGLYFISVLFNIFELMTKQAALRRAASAVLVLGFLFQAAFLASYAVVKGHLPFGNGYEAAAFLSWAIIFLSFIARMKFDLKFLNPVIVMIASALYLAGRGAIAAGDLNPELRSGWFGVHASISLGAYAAFAIALLSGMLYLVEERRLKLKRPGIIKWLPSLEALDIMNYRAISIGFFLLTLGIVTGCIWAQFVWGSWWSWDAKEVWALATWFVYAALFHIRLTSTLRGRKVAIISVLGFAFVLFTFLGASNILPSAHNFF